MGSSNSTSRHHRDDPWWSIENENLILNQPNLLVELIQSERDSENLQNIKNYIQNNLTINKNNNNNNDNDKNINDIKNIIQSANKSHTITEDKEIQVELNEDKESSDRVKAKREQSFEEFKQELNAKRMARQGAVTDLRNQITDLRRQLSDEREISRKLRKNIVLINHTTQTDLLNKNDHATNTDQIEPEEKFEIVYYVPRVVEDDEIDYTETEADHNVTVDGDDDDDDDDDGNNAQIDNFKSSDFKRSPRSRTSSETSTSLRSQLAEVQLALQLANSDNLSLSTELNVQRKQVKSLKEVITCSKQMLEVREEQVTQLKAKLHEIEESFAERELKIMSDNLRQEYDRQLANIRNLRQLYEERSRVSAAERENLLRQISIKKDELAAEIEKTKNLEERISTLENELETSNQNLSSTKIQRDEFKYESKELKEQMAVINKLFSQMLMGFNGANNLDIDRLTTMLEENRTLLNEIATNETDFGGACLPKLLFDIVKQANEDETVNKLETDKTNEINNDQNEQEELIENNNSTKVVSAQEIIGNLPKVWRVLIELLNHHKIEQVEFQENGQSEDCYKSVETPTGPKAELSVSKTYIKLKDLILEKKALQKETNKLKTLNSHLDRRLHEQEKRLSTVSLELTKTWHLVGKMQRQHRQLHTHEQILRYQLQQKRRLLSELKEELEYCRRKWQQARAKNDESQIQCDDMRREFAKRKLQDANNSAESGYSDGPGSDEDDIETPKRNYHSIFENNRKIERMQSVSPNRSLNNDIIPRGSSAPPIANFIAGFLQTTSDISSVEPLQNTPATRIVIEDTGTASPSQPSCSRVENASSSGTIPKHVRLSRSIKREKVTKPGEETLEDMFLRLSGASSEPNVLDDDQKRSNRADRIHRLEEQCKSLIAQVIETSNYREELNLQLSKFRKELSPTAVPLRAIVSGTPESDSQSNETEPGEIKADLSCLTPREEEYTSRRAERLRRLEEESKQLMSRIKRTTDRGKNMKSLLDQIHSRRVNSREGSTDTTGSTSETDVPKDISQIATTSQETIVIDAGPSNAVLPSNNLENDENAVKLTPEEEAYTAKRSERLKRLEEESKLLISKLSRNARRGTAMNTRLDELHSRYGSGESSERGTPDRENQPSTSEHQETRVRLTSEDEAYTEKRAERLRKLEEEGKELLSELSGISHQSDEMDSDHDCSEEQIVNNPSSTDTTQESVSTENLQLPNEHLSNETEGSTNISPETNAEEQTPSDR